MNFKNIERVLERVTIFAALVASLTLSVIYRGDVDSLKSALAASCSQKVEFHNASHKAIGAAVTYYRGQLELLNSNYANQLKIISGYPKSAQHAAIVRVNANRTELQNVLTTDQAAYVAGVDIACPH